MKKSKKLNIKYFVRSTKVLYKKYRGTKKSRFFDFFDFLQKVINSIYLLTIY